MDRDGREDVLLDTVNYSTIGLLQNEIMEVTLLSVGQ